LASDETVIPVEVIVKQMDIIEYNKFEGNSILAEAVHTGERSHQTVCVFSRDNGFILSWVWHLLINMLKKAMLDCRGNKTLFK
jgi:hypothetical protein